MSARPAAECLHHGNAAAAIVVNRLSGSEAMSTLTKVDAMTRSQRTEVEDSVRE